MNHTWTYHGYDLVIQDPSDLVGSMVVNKRRTNRTKIEWTQEHLLKKTFGCANID